MRKNNYLIFYLIQFTFGIIQNIIGLILYVFLLIINPRRPRTEFFGSKVIKWNSSFSASLGIFIFFGEVDKYNLTRVLSHEYGHCIQSCILGPLYLLIIGIPSFIWAHNRKYIRNRSRGYYRYSDFYPEKWANYLGKKYTNLEGLDY